MQKQGCSLTHDGCQDEHVILARGQCQVDGMRYMQSIFNLKTGSEAGLGNKCVNGRPSLHIRGHVQGSKSPMTCMTSCI